MAYERNRDLPRIMPVWQCELDDAEASREGHAALICRLADALRAERQNGLAGHWTYDAGRHRALRWTYHQELSLYIPITNTLAMVATCKQPSSIRGAS